MFEQFGGFLVGLASFIAVLSVVVFVHEFGHFQVARWFKIKVDSFSIGFGPRIFRRVSKAGIEWRLGALPLGGYVKFTGDKDASSAVDFSQPKADASSGLFYAQPVGVRAAVTAAGPMANFVFAIGIFTMFFAIFGEVLHKPIVNEVIAGGAAAEAGIKPGDEIVAVNGKPIRDFKDLSTIVIVSGGEELALDIKRSGDLIQLKATPKVIERPTAFGDIEKQGALQIVSQFSASTAEVRRYNPIEAVGRAGSQTWSILETQVKFISALARGAMSPGHLSGPLGIGQIAGKVTSNSVEAAGPGADAGAIASSVLFGLVQLMAVISIAVGFMNLLPLPVLDGGHLVFYAAEALRGKPLSERVQAVSYQVGLVCLLSLFVFATFQDLDRSGLFNLLKGAGAAG